MSAILRKVESAAGVGFGRQKVKSLGAACLALVVSGVAVIAMAPPETINWAALAVLLILAIVMEGIHLEPSDAVWRLTFSLPFVACAAITSGFRAGLAVCLITAAAAGSIAFTSLTRSQSARFAWHLAADTVSFAAASAVVFQMSRMRGGWESSWLLACVFVIVFSAVGAGVRTLLEGSAFLSAYARSAGDSLWLGIAAEAGMLAMAAAGCFLISSREILLIPLLVVPAAALRAGIAYRIRMESNYADTITALALMLQGAHPYTHEHVDRVAEAAERVGRMLGLSRRRARLVRTAAVLHDIGKIAIDEAILDKPGRLTEEEFTCIKAHPEIGAKILEPVKELYDIAEWVRSHHERPDGTGYPAGLIDVEIPLESKIISVVDAFDAMTDNDDEHGARTYRVPKSTAEAVAELRRCAGSQFDPEVVEAFALCCQAAATEKKVPIKAKKSAAKGASANA